MPNTYLGWIAFFSGGLGLLIGVLAAVGFASTFYFGPVKYDNINVVVAFAGLFITIAGWAFIADNFITTPPKLEASVIAFVSADLSADGRSVKLVLPFISIINRGKTTASILDCTVFVKTRNGLTLKALPITGVSNVPSVKFEDKGYIMEIPSLYKNDIRPQYISIGPNQILTGFMPFGLEPSFDTDSLIEIEAKFSQPGKENAFTLRLKLDGSQNLNLMYDILRSSNNLTEKKKPSQHLVSTNPLNS